MPLAALSAFLMTSRSTEAGMKFLIVGALSSALMLYGMALIFGFTGSTTLEGIAAVVAAPAQNGVAFGSYALLVGIVLILVGFGFKICALDRKLMFVFDHRFFGCDFSFAPKSFLFGRDFTRFGVRFCFRNSRITLNSRVLFATDRFQVTAVVSNFLYLKKVQNYSELSQILPSPLGSILRKGQAVGVGLLRSHPCHDATQRTG